MKQLFQLGRWLRASCCRLLAFAALAVAASTALAQVTIVPPFVGDHSETWERFGVSEIPDGTSILGGIATITGTDMVTAKFFIMCTVTGKPSDGDILMDSDRPSGPLTISFLQPVSAFGAYWGSGLRCFQCCGFGDAPSILTFRDVNGNVIGSDSFFNRGDGTLMWRGYRFDTPVKTITRTAGDGQEGIAMDGLQAIVAPSGPPSPLVNISTRAGVLTGDNVLIGGFIISGTDNKKVVLRALGPSLSNPPFNIAGVLQNPTIELHDGTGAIIISNDNWKDTQQTDIAATGLAPTNDFESAILRSLPPGNYSAIVRGKDGGTGVGLVEAYDVDTAANAKLTNISTRGFVGINDNVMIGGFIVGTGGSAKVLVRAIGPSLLTQFQIQGALADPVLSLFDGNGMSVAVNDNWKQTQQADIQATGLAPTDDHESAILAILPSGSYTIIVRGQNNTTGVGLVEVFNLQ
jgi:hypothetical protein